MNEKLKRPYLWLWLIALLHVPMVVIQYVRLWSYEHYQFFPFALGAFAWLVATRRIKSAFAWPLHSTALLVLDLLFLGAGYFLNSPWLVCIGAIFLCFSVCFALRDSEVDSSLAYLGLLPLITIRLPLAMDTQVIQWLQKATTHVASDFLNHFGYLHLREGNVLEFPAKRFLVEEACSGVQSLFTLLFLAALIACGHRRRWLHTILVLISAFCFAGLMNVIRVASVSMAWFSLEVDLTTGWQHDAIGYAALIVAAMLVFSADAFLSLIFAPVPDIPGGGVSSMIRNPVTSIWNWLFLVRVSKPQASSVAPNQEPAEKDSGRNSPTFADLLMPRNLFAWLWHFVESWFLSREPKLLLTSVPFLVVGLGGVGFMSWLQTAPNKSLVEMYEKAADDAFRAGDLDARSVYLKSLVRLRPADLHYRFSLATHLLENDQPEEALSQIQVLTQPGPNDYAPARVWLAQQACGPEPIHPLSIQQIEAELLAALKLQPRNIMAKELLAQVLQNKGQLKGAETHLLDVVDEDPRLLLTLVRLQKQLRRSDEQIQFHLDNAIAFFEKSLMSQPGNVASRVSLAESLLLAERGGEAERVLLEGLADTDAPELRSALAILYCQLAVRKMKESALNREHCSELVTKSLKLAPENQNVLAQALFLLSELRVSVDPESLQPPIEQLKKLETLSSKQQLLLVQALAIGNRLDEAIERLEPLATENPELRIMQARFLRAAERTNEFELLVARVVADAEVDNDPSVLTNRLNAAEVLNVASRFTETLVVLKGIKQEATESTQQLRRWKILFSQATLATYDSKLKAQQFENADEALGLLNEVLEQTTSSLGVLERLVTLSFSEGDFAKPAKAALDKLLVTGAANSQIYTMVGSQALAKNQIGQARRYLETAYQMSRADPMVLNNLALVLVRDEITDVDRALRLTNDALEVAPSHPDILSTRAEVYIALERWEDARGDLEASLPKRPDSIGCHTLLAQVWEKIGDSSRAEAHRRRVLELSNGS